VTLNSFGNEEKLMSIWIVTTGSSDVQLRSDESWNSWHRNTKHEYKRLPFKPNQIEDDSKAPFRLASRVLGLIYDGQPEEVWKILQFPLLDEFVIYLQTVSDLPSQIILLLTDQSQIFAQSDREDDKNSPYWQDTCGLEVILRRYFAEKLPGVNCVSLVLEPSAQDEGLDDWNAVLNIVDRALSKVEVEENASVYVSHQAGTPAISSAVQFTSLSRFGQQVKFLVSNEYRQDRSARTIESSTYLRGLQLQQAKALLDRYDYSGVEGLLRSSWQSHSASAENIQNLLEIAIQWNFAKFEDFAKSLLRYPNPELAQEAQERLSDPDQYWWIGYEAAYLGAIRFEQGNTVEALFHSFRSIEGLISRWAKWRHCDHVYDAKKGSPTLKISILNGFPQFLGNSKQKKMRSELEEKKQIGLYSFPLYELLRVTKPEWRENPHIKTVWDTAAPLRNDLFHQLRGLYEIDVFEAWNTSNQKDWESRILGCLNFVSEKKFVSLQEASLMAKVHQELVNEIAAYQSQI
jgi:hypothetical protein